jgi:hypothetical protein
MGLVRSCASRQDVLIEYSNREKGCSEVMARCLAKMRCYAGRR